MFIGFRVNHITRSLEAVAGPFKKLGLKPEMAAKFVPLLTQFVESKGGAGVGALLAGGLK